MRTKNGFKELAPPKPCAGRAPRRSFRSRRRDCPTCDEIIGQERALKAIQTGLDIKSLGYNIFITGMVGTGRTTTIKQLLEQLEKGDKTPGRHPLRQQFQVSRRAGPHHAPGRPGQGSSARPWTNLIEMLKDEHPRPPEEQVLLGANGTASSRRQQKKQKDLLQAFEEEAAEQGFSVIQVQMGLFTRPDLIPVIEGHPMPFAKLEALVKEKKLAKKTVDDLRDQLREADEQARDRLRVPQGDRRGDPEPAPGLGRRVDHPHHQGRHRRDPGASSRPPEDRRLPRPGRGEPDHEHRALQEPEEGGAGERSPETPSSNTGSTSSSTTPTRRAPRSSWRPTRTTSTSSARSSPSSPALGIGQTDFTRIKAGSFLKANGGYLVVNALDALVEPGVWATLKRTLRNQIFEIQNYAADVPVLDLPPQARADQACNVKVVMIGDAYIYNLLYSADEDFKKIFKIKAEFDSEMTKDREDRRATTPGSSRRSATRTSSLPFDQDGHRRRHRVRDAHRRPAEEGLDPVPHHRRRHPRGELLGREGGPDDRRPGGRREGHRGALRAGQPHRGQDPGDDRGRHHHDRHRGRGRRPGQRPLGLRHGPVHVRQADPDHRPDGHGPGRGHQHRARSRHERAAPTTRASSSSAATSAGNTPRRSRSPCPPRWPSSSPTAGSTATAPPRPRSTPSSRASSGLPLRQDLAVTGSLNQKGEIQPIGGVNEKIEGFFDVCRPRASPGPRASSSPTRTSRT